MTIQKDSIIGQRLNDVTSQIMNLVHAKYPGEEKTIRELKDNMKPPEGPFNSPTYEQRVKNRIYVYYKEPEFLTLPKNPSPDDIRKWRSEFRVTRIETYDGTSLFTDPDSSIPKPTSAAPETAAPVPQETGGSQPSPSDVPVSSVSTTPAPHFLQQEHIKGIQNWILLLILVIFIFSSIVGVMMIMFL